MYSLKVYLHEGPISH